MQVFPILYQDPIFCIGNQSDLTFERIQLAARSSNQLRLFGSCAGRRTRHVLFSALGLDWRNEISRAQLWSDLNCYYLNDLTNESVATVGGLRR